MAARETRLETEQTSVKVHAVIAVYCLVKIGPTKNVDFRRSLRARPSAGEGRVLVHWTPS